MPDIEMPDPEDLGGNVTKPFKFVTGWSSNANRVKAPTSMLTRCCSWYETLERSPTCTALSPRRSAHRLRSQPPNSWKATNSDIRLHRLRCPFSQPEPVGFSEHGMPQHRVLKRHKGPSTAGKITSTITNASSLKEKSSGPADK